MASHNKITWTGKNFLKLKLFVDDNVWECQFKGEYLFNLVNTKTGDIRSYFAPVTFYKINGHLAVEIN